MYSLRGQYIKPMSIRVFNIFAFIDAKANWFERNTRISYLKSKYNPTLVYSRYSFIHLSHIVFLLNYLFGIRDNILETKSVTIYRKYENMRITQFKMFLYKLITQEIHFINTITAVCD